MPKIWSYSQFRSFFIGQSFENYDFLFGKSLEFLIHKKIAMLGAFFDEKYTKKPWFYNRKMNWTFLFIFVQVHSISELSSVQVPSAKKWTEFSSKFTKKVNFWTELNFSVQFSHFLGQIYLKKTILKVHSELKNFGKKCNCFCLRLKSTVF